MNLSLSKSIFSPTYEEICVSEVVRIASMTRKWLIPGVAVGLGPVNTGVN